jgi:hypothetical protein
MINIASSQPVHLPVAHAPAVAPVGAVTAVTPTQRTQGDGHSGLGSDRDSRPGAGSDTRQAKGGKSSPLQAAPLLPRESAQASRSERPAEKQVTANEKAREAHAAVDKAAENSLKLMEVLSTVWKASAAVVEDALGIAKSRLQGAGGAQPVEGQLATGQNAVPHNGSIAAPNNTDDNPLLGRAAGDPVAYTEKGDSEWLPLESGQLVSEKV